MYATSDAQELRYAPIISKIKLNKKRKVLDIHDNGDRNSQVENVENIVISSRGYSKREATDIQEQLKAAHNTNYKISAHIVNF